MGTYDNQSALLYKGKLVGIDNCIKDEIERMWLLGIDTFASCCGHNVGESILSVDEKDIAIMKSLGYKTIKNRKGLCKSIWKSTFVLEIDS
jgi:hypothetical protein